MNIKNIIKLIGFSVLIAPANFAMESEYVRGGISLSSTNRNQDIEGKIISIQSSGEKNNSIAIYQQPNLPASLTSSEILLKSLSYGLLEGTIIEISTMLEILLHNAILKKGPDAAAFLAEELGKLVGDRAGKFGIKLAVTTIINAMTAPIDGPSNALAVANGFAILDGIIKDAFLKKIDDKVAEAKKKLAEEAGLKAQELVNYKISKENETEEERSHRELYSFIAKHGACYASYYGLDLAEQILRENGKEHISNFIRESEYTKSHAGLIENTYTCWSSIPFEKIALCNLWFNHPLYAIKKETIQTCSDRLMDNELYFVPKTTSYVGSLTGYFIGKIVGNYAIEKALDEYLAGSSRKFVESIKENPLMIDLESHTSISRERYLEILEREIAVEEQSKKAQKEKEELNEVIKQEFSEIVQHEQNCEQMHIDHDVNDNSQGLTLYTVATMPASAIKHAANFVYNGGRELVNGVRCCANSVYDVGQYLFTQGQHTAWRSLSPVKMKELGRAISGKIAEELFLQIIEKGDLYPDNNRDEIIFLLHNKNSNKETVSYKVCDNIVWGASQVKNGITSLAGENNGQDYEEDEIY